MKIMYPRQKNWLLLYIIMFAILACTFFVLYFKGRSIFTYFIWALIYIIPWLNLLYYRYRPFAFIRNGFLFMDCGVYCRRQKVLIDDIVEMKRFILNNELRGFEIFLKSGKSFVHVAPLSSKDSSFLEDSFNRINSEVSLKKK